MPSGNTAVNDVGDVPDHFASRMDPGRKVPGFVLLFDDPYQGIGIAFAVRDREASASGWRPKYFAT